VIQSSADSLLGEIEAFCRRTGIAESTFGRQAVNDGKLCVRLRNGKDVTLETAAKIRGFIEGQPQAENLNGAAGLKSNSKGVTMSGNSKRKSKTSATADGSADRPFRFYDNRQKYLAFVNTTNEKWKVAERASRELALLKPNPPALRLFDAGMGDATVLSTQRNSFVSCASFAKFSWRGGDEPAPRLRIRQRS
jgi:hypothetical protein